VCAGAQYLGVIMFAIVFAIILNSLGPPAEPLIRVIEIANDAIMAMVRGILLLPFALGSAHCLLATQGISPAVKAAIQEPVPCLELLSLRSRHGGQPYCSFVLQFFLARIISPLPPLL